VVVAVTENVTIAGSETLVEDVVLAVTLILAAQLVLVLVERGIARRLYGAQVQFWPQPWR
jgi:hypothetical protein